MIISFSRSTHVPSFFIAPFQIHQVLTKLVNISPQNNTKRWTHTTSQHTSQVAPEMKLQASPWYIRPHVPVNFHTQTPSQGLLNFIANQAKAMNHNTAKTRSTGAQISFCLRKLPRSVISVHTVVPFGSFVYSPKHAHHAKRYRQGGGY
jgi:hypothetical protein